jgi:hypothetical protein
VSTSFAPHTAGDCNVFETTIRALGGLLAGHRLARESHPVRARRMLDQAADLGARLARAFESPSGAAGRRDACWPARAAPLGVSQRR